MKTLIEVEVKVSEEGLHLRWPRVKITEEDIEALAIEKAKNLYNSPENKTFQVSQVLNVGFSDF